MPYDLNENRANEGLMLLGDELDQYEDKARFVLNLGWLLSQTREGVVSCCLKNNDTVIIYYLGGATSDVNIRHDSYLAIMKDVVNNV